MQIYPETVKRTDTNPSKCIILTTNIKVVSNHMHIFVYFHSLSGSKPHLCSAAAIFHIVELHPNKKFKSFEMKHKPEWIYILRSEARSIAYAYFISIDCLLSIRDGLPIDRTNIYMNRGELKKRGHIDDMLLTTQGSRHTHNIYIQRAQKARDSIKSSHIMRTIAARSQTTTKNSELSAVAIICLIREGGAHPNMECVVYPRWNICARACEWTTTKWSILPPGQECFTYVWIKQTFGPMDIGEPSTAPCRSMSK